MKSPQYKPGKVFPKSHRGYNPEVCETHQAIREHYAKASKYSNAALIMCFAALAAVIVNAIVNINNISFGLLALFMATFVFGIFEIFSRRKLITLYREIVENGGYINNEEMKRKFDRLNPREIWTFVFQTAMVAVIVALVLLRGNIPNANYTHFIFAMTMLNNAYSNSTRNLRIGERKYGIEMLIFCGDRYISGNFTVLYDKITSVVLVEKDEYSDVDYATITLSNGEEQVGHDRMYYEDYEYLLSKINAAEPLPTAP